MKPDEFLQLVERMRTVQKSYFASRRPDDLTAARVLEREVDRAIVEAKSQQRPLFPDR